LNDVIPFNFLNPFRSSPHDQLWPAEEQSFRQQSGFSSFSKHNTIVELLAS